MEDEKHGKPWQADELDAIIADYFKMLAAELAGELYVKSKHSAALMALIGRSHRSVEFKHQNISAVLDELGLPWISGYRPKSNYQTSIFDAIERYLTEYPSIFELVHTSMSMVPPLSAVFVDPPAPTIGNRPIPERLQRLVRKFDPVLRDARNRSMGKAGEEFVMEIERRRLTEANREDLAGSVRWVALEQGDGAGYDILSYNLSGRERLIEVKTTNGGARTPFFLSRNERDVAMEHPAEWCIYRVHLFNKQPSIFTIFPPIEKFVDLVPEVWRASF